MRFTDENGIDLSRRMGEKRVVREFLWLPLTLNYETRWLETASINQKLDYDILGTPFWRNKSWAD